MVTITLTLNINEEELRNIRNALTTLQGKDVLNELEAEAVEGLLTLTDTIKDAVDNVQDDSKCPECGATDEVEWGSTLVDGGSAGQEATCNKCGCHWNNLYYFTKVEIL